MSSSVSDSYKRRQDHPLVSHHDPDKDPPEGHEYQQEHDSEAPYELDEQQFDPLKEPPDGHVFQQDCEHDASYDDGEQQLDPLNEPPEGHI